MKHALRGRAGGRGGEIANEKWLICLFSSAAAKIASENTGYSHQILSNGAFQTK